MRRSGYPKAIVILPTLVVVILILVVVVAINTTLAIATHHFKSKERI